MTTGIHHVAGITANVQANVDFYAGFLGYSNGANLLGAVLQLHPGAIRRAVLLRSVQALETPPKTDVEDTNVLMVNGAGDPFGRMAPALEKALRDAGAQLDMQTLPAGDELTPEDAEEVKEWLTENTAPRRNTSQRSRKPA